jgi:hypothetical protein
MVLKYRKHALMRQIFAMGWIVAEIAKYAVCGTLLWKIRVNVLAQAELGIRTVNA